MWQEGAPEELPFSCSSSGTGWSHPTVPLVPLTGGFLKTLEGRSFSDLLSDPTYLWASGDPSIKWTEGNASSLGVFLSL